MPRFISPLLYWSRLGTVLVITALVACNAGAPTPEPTAEPTKFAVSAVPGSTRGPTESSKETSTASPTATDTLTPEPSQTPPGPTIGGGEGGSGISGNVWFMGQLVAYFDRLGPYPPELPLDRPPNVNPLTGLVVTDPTLLQRRPILARLGNDPSARPQAGLNQADLVFEELIDQRHGVFALTRLTAVFYGQNATARPFRSARPVNASLISMFDGALAHSGASKGNRYLFSNLPWGKPVTHSLNLDDLWYGQTYCTIGSYWATRMVSTVGRIHQVLAAENMDTPVALRGFPFSETAPAGPPAARVGLDHNPWPVAAAGSAVWQYDPGSGRYLRFAGGVPHDTQQFTVPGKWGGPCSVSGPTRTEQVSASNVVVLDAVYDATEIVEDSGGFASAFVQLTGSGAARIFRDGIEIDGTWTRPTLQHFFEFRDSSGQVIPFKPGNTWFEIAPLNYVPTVH